MMDILDVIEAASLLSVHPVTLRRLAKAGRIPGRKVGRAWKFSRPALVSFVGQVPAADLNYTMARPGQERPHVVPTNRPSE